MSETIPVDRMHVATYNGGEWTLAKRNENGVYKTIDRWVGTQRAFRRRLEKYGLYVCRQGEEVLAKIPEMPVFPEDPERLKPREPIPPPVIYA